MLLEVAAAELGAVRPYVDRLSLCVSSFVLALYLLRSKTNLLNKAVTGVAMAHAHGRGQPATKRGVRVDGPGAGDDYSNVKRAKKAQ